MAAPTTFGTTLGDGYTPWEVALDKNQRTVFVPELMDNYVSKSMFYRMIDYSIDLGAMHTGEVVFTQRLRSPANIAPLDLRALWLPQLYTDSRQIRINCARFGDKIMMHKYDDRVTYWQKNGQTGLKAIMGDDLGPHMVESLDKLARNAFITSPFCSFAGGATGFGGLEDDDVFDPGPLCRGVQFTMEYDPDIVNNPAFCLTSPAATYQIRSGQVSGSGTTEWMEKYKYANPQMLINYEIGAYESVRFSTNFLLTLWNCGKVISQTTITETIAVGDGAPDPATTKVDAVWEVGQDGATHQVTVADSSGFKVGDVVTLHRVRNASQDSKHVLDGVQFDHPYNMDLRIVGIPDGTHLQFSEPILMDWYVAQLSASLFGYITKAKPVHVALFIKGPRAVVAGVIAPPQTYNPAPIDDTESVWRFSWDAYMKYQVFMSNRMEVHFFAGPVPILNRVVTVS